MKCILTFEYERETATEQEKELISQLLGLPTVTTKVTVAEKPQKKAEKKVETPVEDKPQPKEEKPATEPKNDTVKITVTDLRDLCLQKSKKSAEDKAKVVEAIRSFGVETIFQLPEDKYDELKTKLEAI